jgi:hypothetical protein
MAISVKATLHAAIDRLSEADCQRLWQLWQIQMGPTQAIARHPPQPINFLPVTAIAIPGPTAAQSLIEDRR